MYEPEKKYPLWTTRRIMELVASAAAVLAFSMVKLPGYELDLVSTGLTFSAIYWGAPVAGFGSMIGSALRATISGWSIADIVSCAFNDAALYSILAIVWRRFVEGRKIERRILGYILFLISWFVTHNLVWIPPYGVIAFPWEMFVPWWIFEYELWLIPVSAITIVLGIVGAESAIRLTRPK